MKVLLTGASGFLGTIITQTLNQEGLDIITLARTGATINVDLANSIPQLRKFNLVIHSAGKAHSVPKTESEKIEFHEVNVVGTNNLLKGLEKYDLPEQFVFISSVSVYGQESGLNINEEFPLQALDAYGLSKIEAENLVEAWCKKHNVVCTILRLPLLVGKNPPGNLGAMIKAIDKGYYFNIGGGIARKSMVLAQDVAAFILKIAVIGGTYNLTDGVHPDFNELSSVIAKQKNKRTPYNLPLFIAKMICFVGDMLGDRAPINSLKLKKITSDLTFDDSKARKTVGWKSEGVLDWFKMLEF